MPQNSDAPSVPDRVAFKLTDGMKRELTRLMTMTGISSAPELFRHAFMLLKIHVEAAREGKEVHIVNKKNPSDRTQILLPFLIESGK